MKVDFYNNASTLHLHIVHIIKTSLLGICLNNNMLDYYMFIVLYPMTLLLSISILWGCCNFYMVPCERLIPFAHDKHVEIKAMMPGILLYKKCVYIVMPESSFNIERFKEYRIVWFELDASPCVQMKLRTLT